MAMNITAERRILGDAFDAVAPSHYPALADLPAEEVLALARSLRWRAASRSLLPPSSG